MVPEVVWLARHGETEWNLAGRRQGQLDSPLTPRGRAHAVALAELAASLSVDVIFTSPLGRARETASICAERTRAQLVVVDELAEVNHGDMAGLTDEEIERRFPGALDERDQGKYSWRFPGGESYADAFRRAEGCARTTRRGRGPHRVSRDGRARPGSAPTRSRRNSGAPAQPAPRRRLRDRHTDEYRVKSVHHGGEHMIIRAAQADERAETEHIVADAFGEPDDGRVVQMMRALDTSAATRAGLVAVDGGTVGYVRLSRAWLDTRAALVEVLTLTPLAVSPRSQQRGIGTALVEAALHRAAQLGYPAVFLEGDPSYYGTRGFERAGTLGFGRPSDRIPEPAFQVAVLSSYQPDLIGRLVYPEAIWTTDCVGLRDPRLARVEAELGS